VFSRSNPRSRALSHPMQALAHPGRGKVVAGDVGNQVFIQ
jgi:hypothetical protein